MNGLEEIQGSIKNFIYERQQVKNQISEIEEKRAQLAQERNEKKNANGSGNVAIINELGKQISELGNQSQELQNKLDSRFNEVKTQVNLSIDNLIAEGIRRIRKIEEEREDLEYKIKLQEERNEKYEIQKQEFYERFGRVPELSENAIKEDKIQDKECLENKVKIQELEEQIENIEIEITEFARTKREFKNGDWAKIINEDDVEEEQEENVEEFDVEVEEESITLPLMTEEVETIKEAVEELQVEKFEPLEELQVEEFEPVEEFRVEEFEPIEELQVEQLGPIEEIQVEEFTPVKESKTEKIEVSPIREFKTFGVEEDDDDVQMAWKIQEDDEEEKTKIQSVSQAEKAVEEKQIDEIEEMARTIIEEIVAEQTKDLNIEESEEKQEEQETIQKIEQEPIKEEQTLVENILEEPEEEIITFEDNDEEKIQMPLFTERVALSGIIAKIENGELVYKAQISNGDEIKVYPTKLETGNLLLKYKENRNMLKEILINYAVTEYKTLDKKVINKLDPIVCELLIAYSKKYNYDTQKLIYNYAMSFSKTEECELYLVPEIVYNFAYIDEANLSKKEKKILSNICKNANKNEKINMIGCITKFGKIKYALKRIFAVNATKSLPEGKY